MPWLSSIRRTIGNLFGSCCGRNDADRSISERASSFEFSGPTHHNGTGYIGYAADGKTSEIELFQDIELSQEMEEINLQIQSNNNEIENLRTHIKNSINYYIALFSGLVNASISCAGNTSLEAQQMNCINKIKLTLELIGQNYENIYTGKITNSLEAAKSRCFNEGLIDNHPPRSFEPGRMISRDREYIAGQKNLIIYLRSSLASVRNLVLVLLSVDCLHNAVDHLANITNTQARELREMQHSIELDYIEEAELIETDSHRSPSSSLSGALSISSESLCSEMSSLYRNSYCEEHSDITLKI